MPNFTIKFQKPSGEQGTYELYAESRDDAVRLIAARRLPTMNNWISWNVVSPGETTQSTTQTKQPEKKTYTFYDWKDDPVQSSPMTEYEAMNWARENNLSTSKGEIGWHEIIDPDTGQQVRYFGTDKQASAYQAYGKNLPKVAGGATTQAPITPSGGQTTGDTTLDTLLGQLGNFMKDLVSRGMTINPNVPITEEQLAEFTKIAEKEIDPFYSNQLKVAREQFLTAQGYDLDDIQTLETKLERQYGTSYRTLSEQMAEKGFALSGERRFQEEQLAEGVGEQLSQARTSAQRQATERASQFAQLYGTAQLSTSPGISQYRAIPGEPRIEKTRELPLYQLSPSVYEGLVGSQEYEQRAAKRGRTAELAGLTRELGGIEEVRKLL